MFVIWQLIIPPLAPCTRLHFSALNVILWSCLFFPFSCLSIHSIFFGSLRSMFLLLSEVLTTLDWFGFLTSDLNPGYGQDAITLEWCREENHSFAFGVLLFFHCFVKVQPVLWGGWKCCYVCFKCLLQINCTSSKGVRNSHLSVPTRHFTLQQSDQTLLL